jgi:hypothetical protein
MRKKLAHKPSRPDDGEAFLPDPEQGGPARADDDLAEELAEEFVRSATSAEEAAADARDELLPEELGGPFVEVPASDEFDRKPDASNPTDAEREPFPRAIRAPYR